MSFARTADAGVPIVAAAPQSEIGKLYTAIAKSLAAQISIAGFKEPQLAIVEE